MQLSVRPGDHLYAIVVEDGGLWLAVWVRRAARGDVYAIKPGDPRAPHATYHVDGRRHMRGERNNVWRDGRLFGRDDRRQSLTDPSRPFRGVETLGSFYGFAPKTVGAQCDPSRFTGLLRLPPGILGPRNGGIAVDLVEPGNSPMGHYDGHVIRQEVFREVAPWLALTVFDNV